jgi:hypothetical protein
MTHHPRLPEIMPGQLRLRLAHGYATRTNADAAWLDAQCPQLHYHSRAGRVHELRGQTTDGHILRVLLTPADAPTHVAFTIDRGPQRTPQTLHVPLGGPAARTMART